MLSTCLILPIGALNNPSICCFRRKALFNPSWICTVQLWVKCKSSHFNVSVCWHGQPTVTNVQRIQCIEINVRIYLNIPDKMLTLKCENYILWQSGEDDVFTCDVQKYMHDIQNSVKGPVWQL